MPKLILFSEYTTSIEHAVNNVEYISTREGVVTDTFSTTPNQKNYLDALCKDIGRKELEQLSSFLTFEHEPTKLNASKLLNDLENMFEHKLHAINYLEYSANRKGSHGLFNEKGLVDHEQASKQIRKEAKTTYMHVVALEHDNAVATGFDKLESWQHALKTVMPEFASKMKIDMDDLVWFGAFHEHKNPHVHITMYSKSNKAWLNKKDFEGLRKLLGQQIYAQEMKEHSKEFKVQESELINQLKDLSHFSSDTSFHELLKHTHEQLKTHTGRSYYQYLEQGLKDQVAQIVEYMITNNESNYQLFCETLEASKKYTDIYSNNNSFVEDFVYPGNNQKKQVHNFIIDYLKNQYPLLENAKEVLLDDVPSDSQDLDDLDSHTSSLELTDLNKIHQIQDVDNQLLNELFDTSKFVGDTAYFKLIEKAHRSVTKQNKLSNYSFASKEIKQNVSKLMTYVVNNDHLANQLLEQYASIKDETVDNVKRELLYPTRSSDVSLHNKMLKQLSNDFSDDIKQHQDVIDKKRLSFKDLIQSMEDQLASELLEDSHDTLTDYTKMFKSLEYQYYKSLDVDAQAIINNFVEKTIINNDSFKSLFDNYIHETCQSHFDRSLDKQDATSYFIENKPILERKFVDGQLNTSLHNYVLEALKSMNNDISSSTILDMDKLTTWSDEVKTPDIKIDNDLSYYQTVKAIKTIAKAYVLSQLKNSEVILLVDEIIKANNLDLVYNKDELVKDVFSTLAKDKTLSDLNNQPLRLSKKDIELLNECTESKLEYDQVYTQPNTVYSQDYAVGFGNALLKLGKSLEKSDPVNKNKAPTQSKQKNKRKNQSMHLDI